MRRIVGILLVLAVVGGAAVLAGAEGGSSSSTKKYKAVFDNAFGLTEGGDLKIAGVRAGATTGFEVSHAKPRKAVVDFEITEPGVGELRKDASCIIRPQSLIGEYFVDCQPGKSKEKLPDGGTVPVQHTASTIAIDLVNNILRRPYRERLRLIIAELGTGLAGRGGDLAEVLRRAHPGLRETNKTLRILAGQSRTIQQFIGDASTVVAELNRRKADVSRFVTEAGNTAAITATRRTELRRNFQKLPGFLDQLGPYSGRLERLADQQIPLLGDLQRGAPALDRALRALGPFSDASRPAIRGLGRASRAGTRAFRESSREVKELRRLARKAPATAKPLRQLLEALDDRRRAVENDPRAKATAPPAPDKTAIAAGSQGGFTGYEGLLDYFYWQALAINSRDNTGHVLRLLGINDTDCVPYFTTKTGSEREFAKCNQFLGPDQPGVTTPDTTTGGAAAQSTGAAKPGATGASPRRAGTSAPAGAGESPGFAPGKAPAKPQVTLPPALQNLLGGVRSLGNKQVAPQSGANSSDDMLLDYLLGS